MSFRDLMQDIITVVHKDGSRDENIRASVQQNKILTETVTVDITVEDRIERELPSGRKEVLFVTDVHFQNGFGGIDAFYEIKFKREGTAQHQTRPPMVNVHVSDSPQAHVNLGSTDQSISVSGHQSNDVFEEIRELLKEHVTDENEHKRLLEGIEAMERGREEGDFITAYKVFIAMAANHMTVLAPVLPRLADLL